MSMNEYYEKLFELGKPIAELLQEINPNISLIIDCDGIRVEEQIAYKVIEWVAD